MRNTTSYQHYGSAYASLEPIPANVVPLPVRLPHIDRQPAPHEAKRALEALVLAFGTHGFAAARVMQDCGTTHRQGVMSLLTYRPQHDTYVTVTIEHTQRYGLIAIARWTLTDAQRRRRETTPLGFAWDADTTSVSLARRIVRELAAYEARVCVASSAFGQKRAA